MQLPLTTIDKPLVSHTSARSPSTLSSTCVDSPSVILCSTSSAAFLCRYSLLLPHLYEKVHLGHPLSLMHGHSDSIRSARPNAFSSLSNSTMLAPFPPMLPS